MPQAGEDVAEPAPLADPLRELERWIADARDAGLADAAAAAFVTVGADGQPSARTVSLKRIEGTTLLLTSALWTRKVTELTANPRVALLFHWRSLRRQVHVTATAEVVDDPVLADELFAERGEGHQWQAVVSRQGEPIADLAPLRERLAQVRADATKPPARPADWGVLRLTPTAFEFWEEAADRLHERRRFTGKTEGTWSVSLLAP